MSWRRMVLGLSAVLGTAAVAGVAASQYFELKNPQSAFSALVSERGVDLQRGVAYGDHPRLKMDIYRPSDGDSDAVVLFFYGGGWKKGRRSTYGFVGAALAAKGFTVAVPDYRLYPEVVFPDFMQDAAAAYRHVVRELGGDRPIYLMGHSAGAHMAALLALDDRYRAAGDAPLPTPAGLIGLAGPYAFDPTTWPTTKSIFSGAGTADEARPVAFVSPAAPRALLFHGLDDEIVRLWNMRTFAKALEEAGVAVRAHELEGLGHVSLMLSLARPFRWNRDVLSDISAFIRGPS